MGIKELTTASEGQVKDILSLMGELTSSTVVTPEMLAQAMASATSHFFAIIADDDHIIGCATLCVYDSPTGECVIPRTRARQTVDGACDRVRQDGAA